jgi:hypothetical protein
MTDKAGFRNTFDKGILKLYFKFKRYRYKRWLTYRIYINNIEYVYNFNIYIYIFI